MPAAQADFVIFYRVEKTVNHLKSGESWMAFTNVSSALVARPLALHIGGTARNTLDRRSSYSLTDG